METVIDLLDSIGDDGTRDGEYTVLLSGERRYDGTRFVDSVFKTGNFLRHCGVHDESIVEVSPVSEPETIFGILGTALLEGRVTFTIGQAESPAARLGPTEQLEDTDIPPGCTAIGFGTPPTDPSWAYFGREVWSENPFFPPVEIDPERPFLVSGPTESSFQVLLQQARTVAESLDTGDVVAVREPIDDPGVFATGILGPLVAGATILLPDETQTGTIAVTSSSAPEGRSIDPAAVAED